jgi:phage-related protein
MLETTPKPARFVGSSREDLRRFPDDVRTEFGYAIFVAQEGGRAPKAKPLKGISPGAGILEIVEDFDGNTYRVVYTVKFADAVYVLHAFQKKSKHGIKTPKYEIELIRARFAEAKADYDGRKK